MSIFDIFSKKKQKKSQPLVKGLSSRELPYGDYSPSSFDDGSVVSDMVLREPKRHHTLDHSAPVIRSSTPNQQLSVRTTSSKTLRERFPERGRFLHEKHGSAQKLGTAQSIARLQGKNSETSIPKDVPVVRSNMVHHGKPSIQLGGYSRTEHASTGRRGTPRSIGGGVSSTAVRVALVLLWAMLFSGVYYYFTYVRSSATVRIEPVEKVVRVAIPVSLVVGEQGAVLGSNELGVVQATLDSAPGYTDLHTDHIIRLTAGPKYVPLMKTTSIRSTSVPDVTTMNEYLVHIDELNRLLRSRISVPYDYIIDSVNRASFVVNSTTQGGFAGTIRADITLQAQPKLDSRCARMKSVDTLTDCISRRVPGVDRVRILVTPRWTNSFQKDAILGTAD